MCILKNSYQIMALCHHWAFKINVVLFKKKKGFVCQT